MSRDGNELASNYHMIPQSYGCSLPTASGFSEILHPGPGLPMTHPCIVNHNSQGYTNHSAPAPYVSSHLNSLADAAHLNSVYTAGLHPTQMLMHTNPHFIHINQPPSLTRQPQSIKQEPDFIEQERGVVPGGPPFIKQEPGFVPTFIKQEPDLPPGGHPFIKQEPGLVYPFIKQEPGLNGGVSKEFSLEHSRYVSSPFPFLEKKPVVFCGNGTVNQEERDEPQVGLGKVNTACRYKSVKQEGTGEEFAAFPSQPLHLNFMADIEDIIPSNSGEC